MDILLIVYVCFLGNGMKVILVLSVDVWGDWCEEVIWCMCDNKELCIYMSMILMVYWMVIFMYDL